MPPKERMRSKTRQETRFKAPSALEKAVTMDQNSLVQDGNKTPGSEAFADVLRQFRAAESQ